MEFKEGGYRLYAMVSPEGEKHWSRIDFETINMHVQFSGKDSFCDQDGTINIAAPSSLYIHRFNEIGSKTEIHSDFEYNSEDDLKKIIQMGMKEGLEMACQNLDALLLEITT
jgi:mevalonate pyrophosphate decarboxylase